MRKEVILALILGILLGGVILYGMKLANQSASPTPTGPDTTNTIPTPLPTPKIQTDLNIITPQNHAVVFSSTLPIKGTSRPDTTLIIVSEDDEKIIETTPQGQFETEISLVGGENNILINSFSSDTLIASASIQIIYTTSKIE